MLNHLFKLLSFIALIGISIPVFCQSQVVYSLPDDSMKVIQLYDLGYNLEVEFPDSAIKIYKLGVEISNKINYPIGKGRGLQYQGIVLSDQGKYDESILYYQKSIEVFKTIPYEIGVASTYINIGNVYKHKAQFVNAFQNYLVGTKVLEQVGDTTRLVRAYTGLGAILSDVVQLEKSAYYHQKSLTLSNQIGDSLSICDGLVNLAVFDLLNKKTDNARTKLLKAVKIAETIQDPHSLAYSYNGISEVETKIKNYNKAVEYGKSGLKYAHILRNPLLISMSYSRVGINYYELNQLDSAFYYIHNSIELSEKHQIQESLLDSYYWMALIQEKLDNDKEALKYFKQHQTLNNNASSEKQIRITSGLTIQFETEKKDLAIKEQKLTIEKNEALLSKRKMFISTLLGAILLLAIIFYLIRRSLKQKKKIAENDAALQLEKVEQLQKEQEVVALKSLMEGEENERTRLAKDLHDGLGGLLSVVKLHYSNVDSKQFKNSKDYTKGLELIDQVSTEARTISHNLMPGALVKFGLIDALKDFCNNINNNNSLSIDFQSYNMLLRLPKATETSIYRIIQELVNNVIKHAKADEVIVQLMQDKNDLHITIEDNGIGFDTSKLTNPGIGLTNIQSRIDYLRGTIYFDSVKDEGTTVQITIPIKQL